MKQTDSRKNINDKLELNIDFYNHIRVKRKTKKIYPA
ncbi:hypothetical protein AAA799E16_01790 [Marine Group I thaumarchaeote SCGC AAA799-E16]|uniref:Uncharacterized protein n=4 Tax=Marine Group I TaxID=905826 RepID=A0A081RLA0_9ARCH|nr:hypothetical protein AAA799N04_01608 [Marine Group I thaumarchaeote SCGC AAA799-N04]KER05551.1 hypothetical protein AAA799E16_01790 [Marine Group I thaumarchaeote SCGC AAA799-E16]KFM15614.1 hypothetical protein AAA799D11_01133 [Marine Group I thaumarchaeote SCGC AAA799-D11]KFM15777.1 hypothetical protein SCCGRSA3_02572 [Marine Group I thaumarchaeote SCGC RSA3]